MSTHTSTDTQSVESFGNGKKTLKSYLVGLFASLILTLTAFALVGNHMLSTQSLYVALGLLALMQLFTQVTCFLRMNTSPEGRWNLMPFLFSLVVIVVLVGGSFWIMYNLNYNMMH